MKENNYLLIMAGGVGSRFWPASRENNPKQFLDISGNGKSLIRLTYERFLKNMASSNIYVVTLEKYKEKVLVHLPELSDDQVICEPSRNNTAPCIAYAAFKLYNLNPDANVVVTPADHLIRKEAHFNQVISEGLAFTRNTNSILTLGITPSRPDTGYGYIEMGDPVQDGPIRKVSRFAEKPVLDLAKSYLSSGNYVWNSGLFLFRVGVIIKAFHQFAPGITKCLSPDIIDYNTVKEKSQIAENYLRTPKISIDYAIMEKADNIYVFPAEFGWSDLGTWNSLHSELEKDKDENVIQAKSAMVLDSKNCLVRASDEKIIVVKGLENYIIVDDQDVLLIYPKDKEQEIKAIRKDVQEKFGGDKV